MVTKVPRPQTDESFWERSQRKFKENPFVPLGLGVATYGIFKMMQTLHRRDSTGFQYAQRIRVGAQLGTALVMVAGFYLAQRKAAIPEEPKKVTA